MSEKTRVGYDTVETTAAGWKAVVPTSSPDVLGCYGNGDFANHTAAKEAFPQATIFTYDVHATMPSCDAVDDEAGDANNSQLSEWAREWLKIGAKRHVLPRPTDYSFASNVSAMISTMLDAGFRREDFNILSAHTEHGQHICGPGQCQFPQADGTQWAFSGPAGQNVDQNLFFAHFFKDPKPKFDPHYAWFDDKKRVIFGRRTERAVVKEYDKWRATQSTKHHPHRARLAILRAQLRFGYLRLSNMKDLAPFHREWRARELRERSHGHRFV